MDYLLRLVNIYGVIKMLWKLLYYKKNEKKRLFIGLWIEDEGCYEMICKNYRLKYIYVKF